MNVGEQEIVRCLQQSAGGDEAERLNGLKGQLGCGTGCGSCIPALKQLVRDVRPQMQAA